jgi:hypothetical protein
MRNFFLDKDGRIWFGTPPNNRVGYFYLSTKQRKNRRAVTQLRSEPRYALTCRRARKPLLAGAPASQGATWCRAPRRESSGAVLPAGRPQVTLGAHRRPLYLS